MADESLKQKIRDVLKASTFTGVDDAVDVSDGEVEPNIHVVVFSRKFDQLEYNDRHNLIWNALLKTLQAEELGQVSLLVAVSPEDAKAMT